VVQRIDQPALRQIDEVPDYASHYLRQHKRQEEDRAEDRSSAQIVPHQQRKGERQRQLDDERHDDDL
jgi:hypothetical protein